MTKASGKRTVGISVLALAIGLLLTSWMTKGANAGMHNSFETGRSPVQSQQQSEALLSALLLNDNFDQSGDTQSTKGSAPASTGTPAKQTDKPAEQVYKNIQLFKGLPASRLMGAMKALTVLLGVDCSHCHVVGQFDKDDKPPKQMARNMFKMMENINNDYFGGKERVTCWTCHHGQPQPPSDPAQEKRPATGEKNKTGV